MRTSLTLSLAALASLAASASAQVPLYIDLSPGSTATDVTNTGTDIVVVGTLLSGQPFRWTFSSGVETPLGGGSTTSPRVSTDGNTVSATINGTDQAAYWTVSSGVWTPGPTMGALCGSTDTIAYGLSGDGLTVVGGGYVGPGACAGAHADAWHVVPGTIQDLGGLFSDPASRAFDTNSNGTICVGWKDLLNGTRQGARWVNGVLQPQLIWTDPSTMIPYKLGAAQAINTLGTIIVGGTIYGNPVPTSWGKAAWRIDSGTGLTTPLPNLTGATTYAQALATSNDGTRIVGHIGGNFLGSTAILWVNNVPNQLRDYLVAQSATGGVAGYTDLGIALGISDDGNAICGRGTGIAGGGQPGGGWVVLFAGAQYSGTPFCFGDGLGTACPCGNSGTAGNGCASSINASGAKLAATGVASLTTDTVVLYGSGMPNSSALYFQGTTQQNGGLGSPFGDGLRCAAGTVIRLGTKANLSGASSYPVVGDTSVSVRGLVTASGTRTYQVWYRNAAAFCTAATYNLSNGLEILWIP
jgi:hypothetical protein